MTQSIESIVGIARFVADVTIGKLYLSPVEYRSRIDGYCDTFAAFSWNNLSNLSAEQLVDIGAAMAADFVFPLGATKAIRLLKKVNALNTAQKAQKQVCQYLRMFKNSLKERYVKNGYTVNVDGTVSRFSPDPPLVPSGSGAGIRNTVAHTKEQLFAIEQKIVQEVKVDVNCLRQKYDLTRKGCGDFANK